MKQKLKKGCMWHYHHDHPSCDERCETVCLGTTVGSQSNKVFIEGCFPTCPEGKLYSDRENACVDEYECYYRQIINSNFEITKI